MTALAVQRQRARRSEAYTETESESCSKCSGRAFRSVEQVFAGLMLSNQPKGWGRWERPRHPEQLAQGPAGVQQGAPRPHTGGSAAGLQRAEEAQAEMTWGHRPQVRGHISVWDFLPTAT